MLELLGIALWPDRPGAPSAGRVGTDAPGFYPELPHELTTERAIARLVRRGQGDVREPAEGPATSDETRLTTALFTLLGSRPLTNSAILEVLVGAGAQPAYGRLLARSAAARLGIAPAALASGGNYTERIEPTLRALRALGLVEEVSGTDRAPGRPRLFRLKEEHRGLVQGLLEAFRSGKGLPWIEGDAPSRAAFLLDGARRLLWDREFDRAEAELRRVEVELARRPASPSGRIAHSALRAEALRASAAVARFRGAYGRALRSLARATREYARLAGRHPERIDLRAGWAAASLSLAELEARMGRLGRAKPRVREMLRLHAELTARGYGDWTFLRQLALGDLVRAEVELLDGNPDVALSTLARVDAHLARAAERVPRRSEPGPAANLAMNHARAAVLRAISWKCLDQDARAREAAVRATQNASEAARLADSPNAVVLRWLGIGVRVRLEISAEADSPGRRMGLIALGERAFARSQEVSADEPDTIYEHARFAAVAASSAASQGDEPRARRLRSAARAAVREAQRASRDHPALVLDPRLTQRVDRGPRFPSSLGRMAARSLPSV